MIVRKSASCTECKLNSSSSTSSSESDTPLRRFNRILRCSVARHWAYFRRHRADLRVRGRSVSDAGLCSIVDNDSDLEYLDIAPAPRRSLRPVRTYGAINPLIPSLFISSAGGSGSAVGIEEASDGSDVDRPKRGHHLRVPTPALSGQSTGNFPSGAAGGGCGAPRSAPATPLQLDPHPRTKHDKQVLKPLSGSAPSVRAPALTAGGEAEGKPPSKSRQKKFQRHFPQVGPEERVLNYYSCALVGDLLLQGHLYITKNYFAFYSNVFGYVTKLLIPTTSVLRITKEKVARIIPNAVGVCTRDERHVFGSLLSRDSTYKLMMHVWKAARGPELAQPKPQDLRASEVELDASEYSPEDDSSSGGAERRDAAAVPVRRESEVIIAAAASAAVIQPALLTGAGARRANLQRGRRLALGAALLLACSAALMLARLCWQLAHPQDPLSQLSGAALQTELARWRAALHGRAAAELHSFLTTHLVLLTKVRQSLEALSGVILTDMATGAPVEIPNDAVFS